MADLVRLASGGSGILPAASAPSGPGPPPRGRSRQGGEHVLTMCIRALDYCPPVDITFGEPARLHHRRYESCPMTTWHYRIAFVEAFRRRGIYPLYLRTMKVQSLRWQPPSIFIPDSVVMPPFATTLSNLTRKWTLASDRKLIFTQLATQRRKLLDWLLHTLTPQACSAFGLDSTAQANPANPDDPVNRQPAIDVTALRPARRIGPDGQQLVDLIIEIVQRRWEPQGPPDGAGQPSVPPILAGTPGGFWFRGGCTVVFDLQQRRMRYCIRKDIRSTARLQRQREFLTRGSMPSLQGTYFGRLEQEPAGEAFAFLHASGQGGVAMNAPMTSGLRSLSACTSRVGRRVPARLPYRQR